MGWFTKKTVVVPVDFSEQSMAAVDVGLEAVKNAVGLHVVNVLPILIYSYPLELWDVEGDEARCEAVEEALRQRLCEAKFRGAKIAVKVGDPGREIAKYARRVRAELIVLPSHGRTGVKRLLIGSVAERVCRLAHCPVLVLRS